MEHRHSLRSSAFLSVWLTCSIMFDGAMAHSYFLREGFHDLAAMAVTSAVCKLVTMVLGEVRKTHFVKDPNTGKPASSQEATSGFWSRALYLWLNKTLYAGFQKVLDIDDLDNLGPEFSSELLLDRFNRAWATGKLLSYSQNVTGIVITNSRKLRKIGSTLWQLCAIIYCKCLCSVLFLLVCISPLYRSLSRFSFKP